MKRRYTVQIGLVNGTGKGPRPSYATLEKAQRVAALWNRQVSALGQPYTAVVIDNQTGEVLS